MSKKLWSGADFQAWKKQTSQKLQCIWVWGRFQVLTTSLWIISCRVRCACLKKKESHPSNLQENCLLCVLESVGDFLLWTELTSWSCKSAILFLRERGQYGTLFWISVKTHEIYQKCIIRRIKIFLFNNVKTKHKNFSLGSMHNIKKGISGRFLFCILILRSV